VRIKIGSAAIEEIKPEDWAEKVYKSDIVNNRTKLYETPEYNPLMEVIRRK
jgi:4-oxalocrotonate tautomerase